MHEIAFPPEQEKMFKNIFKIYPLRGVISEQWGCKTLAKYTGTGCSCSNYKNIEREVIS